MSEYQLISEIVSRSVSKTWDKAKLEWYLEGIELSEEPETCLCGHFPIIELCELRNYKNKDAVTVGNCCVKKFLGLPSDRIFTAIKRIRSCITKSLNIETIQYAFSNCYIDEWQQRFYLGILRKRKLSEKQKTVKVRINRHILSKIGA